MVRDDLRLHPPTFSGVWWLDSPGCDANAFEEAAKTVSAAIAGYRDLFKF